MANLRSRIVPPREVRSVPRYDVSHQFKSFGYYVLGGCDLTGEHLSMTNPTTFDSEEDLSAKCGPDAFSNPRFGFAHLAEELGAEKALEKVQ